MPKVLIRTSLIQKIIIYLTMPLLILYYSLESQFLLKNENNAVVKRCEGKLKAHKNAVISRDIPVSAVKEVSKRYGVSINDVVMTVMSNVLK